VESPPPYPRFNISKSKKMKLESQIIDMLQQAGIGKGRTVLDFGCGYGMYTIPVAEIVGEQGTVYALDKDTEALDALMQKAESAGLKNIRRMDTSGELDLKLNDKSVDAVLLFEVYHNFYFPKAKDRRRLLGEIYRIMKPSASLYISVWPNAIGLETVDEIKNAGFRLKKETNGTSEDCNALKACAVLGFKKIMFVTINN
jgi:ubiquinone/menaquinone biosynthesis C-methylase UbiE